MTVLLLLIPLSLVLLGVAVWAFIWAVGRGQFDDLDSPALDILVDRPEEQARGSTDCDDRFVEDAQAEDMQGNGHAD